MKTTAKTLIIALMGLALGAGSAIAAPIFVTNGQTVAGTTTNLILTAGSIVDNPNNNTTLSNSSGNLVITVVASPANSDYYFNWTNAVDGLGFNAASYSYVQVDIAAVSSGLVAGNWEMFWTDTDSTIGGASNSGTLLGSVTPTATPFSIVIDLVNGQSTGATGWGPGTVNNFRFDMFQSASNAGKSWQISAITFGTELVPEPSSLALIGLGGLLIFQRRRR